jgi:hypothetical protein
MDEVRLKEILDATSGHPVRLRESFFKRNLSGLYQRVQDFCVNIQDLPFIQRVWYWTHNNPDYYTCKCGKRSTFHRNWKDGYREFCSQKCSAGDQSTKEKRKKTSLEKWGVDNVSKSDTIKKKLVSLGYDPTLTETQIMHSQNYYRIWGCGQDKWIWKRDLIS